MALELPSNESRTEKPVITQLESGQTIEVEGPAHGLTGMIEVRRQGRTYAVFSRDLEDQGLDVTAVGVITGV